MELRKYHYPSCNNTIILIHLMLNINKNQYTYNNRLLIIEIKIKQFYTVSQRVL